MTQLKRVREIDGHLVLRPAKSHPNPDHWDALRIFIRATQGNSCKVCWRNGDDYTLELHHRHYDTWGNESPNDVAMLCVSCHDAITEVIRNRRRALGDQTLKKISGRETKPKRSPRPKKRKVKVPKTVPVKAIAISKRPKIRKQRGE